MVNRKNLLFAALLGSVPAALTLGLPYIAVPSSIPILAAIQTAGVTLLFPGMLGAIAVSGNVHAFHLWVAAIWNFLFYFLLSWAIAALIGKVRRRFGAPHRAGNL